MVIVCAEQALVEAEVVGGVQVEPGWELAIERAQELQELFLMAVARPTLADRRAVEHAQRRQQRGGPALVVVGHRARPAGLHRQPRLRAIKRLDLPLSLHAQDERLLRGSLAF